jgi:hypothetical protein
VAARKDCSAVEDSNATTAPTGRAEERMSLTAHVQRQIPTNPLPSADPSMTGINSVDGGA